MDAEAKIILSALEQYLRIEMSSNYEYPGRTCVTTKIFFGEHEIASDYVYIKEGE